MPAEKSIILQLNSTAEQNELGGSMGGGEQHFLVFQTALKFSS